MRPKYGLVLPTGKSIRGKRNSGGFCECHILSQTSINFNWEIQQTSILCKQNISSHICCTKMYLDGHSNEVFYHKVRRRICYTFFLWIMLQGISKGECCGAFIFTPNVSSCKQPCDLGIIAAVLKRYKLLLFKDVLRVATHSG